jgi:hypothetical protein
MAIQVLTYAWGIGIIIALVVLAWAVFSIVLSKLRGEKIRFIQTYSFNWVGKTALWCLLIASAISIVIYFSTGSADVAISIYVFIIACATVGILKSLLFEYHIKRRGGKPSRSG